MKLLKRLKASLADIENPPQPNPLRAYLPRSRRPVVPVLLKGQAEPPAPVQRPTCPRCGAALVSSWSDGVCLANCPGCESAICRLGARGSSFVQAADKLKALHG